VSLLFFVLDMFVLFDGWVVLSRRVTYTSQINGACDVYHSFYASKSRDTTNSTTDIYWTI